MNRNYFYLTLLVLFTAASPALAVNSTWTNAFGGSWGTAVNWNPNTFPAAGTSDVANFTNTSLSGTVNVTNTTTGQGAATILFAGSANYVLTNLLGFNQINNSDKVRLAGATPQITVTGSGTVGIFEPIGITLTTGASLGITNNSSGLLTLGANIDPFSVLGTPATYTVTIAGSGNTLLNGAFASANTNNTSLTMAGSGQLTITADPTFQLNQGITVSGGTLIITSPTTGATLTSTHTGGTTVNSGATLQLGKGGTTSSGSFGDPGASTLTDNGTLTFNPGGPNQITFTRSIGGSGAVVKTGPLRVWLQGVSTYAGDTTISQNILDVTADSALGGTSGKIIFGMGAGPGFLRTRGNPNGAANFTTSRTIQLNTNGDLSLLTSPLAADTASFNGPVIGVGGLNIGSASAATAGTVLLAGTNTYTGNTTVYLGTLKLGATGSLPNTPQITIASSATFDVSAVVGGFTLGAAQTLNGNGSVNGVLINNGTIAPGTNASIGTLTFSNAPMLNGTIIAKVNAANLPNADEIILTSGTFNYGGTLVVTNLGAAPANGTVFTLFSASGYGASFAAINFPAGGRAHWTTNNLFLNGTIMFTNIAPMAINIVMGASGGTSATLQIINGQFAPTDADGDTLSVSAIQNPSTQGGTVTTDGTSVTYIPAGNFTGTDNFTYTVSDGFGGVATATITVNVDANGATPDCDICVFGGTSGGVLAAVQAARMGKIVALVEPGNHVGGMTSGGLGWTDFGNVKTITGIAGEFYSRVGQHYGQTTPVYHFEPSAAEGVFNQMLAEAGVTVYFNEQLGSVLLTNQRISQITMASGRIFHAKMFIDTTYEGDLMAAAGVNYTVGREGTNTYGEATAGIAAGGNSGYNFDPYVIPGNPASGLLPLVGSGNGGIPGQGDNRVQAYNFRMCFTQVATNMLPILPPTNYSETNYELLNRYLAARVAQDGSVTNNDLISANPEQNGKYDINNNGDISTDFIGQSATWATNTYAGRAVISQAHEDYMRGFFYYLATSTNVPLNVRTQMQSWGMAKDEFQDSGGWPSAIYVREARRMISDYVGQGADLTGQRVPADPIALASYMTDCHGCQRFAGNGVTLMEGGHGVAFARPWPISYRSIIPSTIQCQNLFCTFAMSLSHLAFSSYRMEPPFMMTSAAAATAASFAIDDNVPAQQVNYAKLALQLAIEGQMLQWVTSLISTNTSTNSIVIDNNDAGVTKVGSDVTSLFRAT